MDLRILISFFCLFGLLNAASIPRYNSRETEDNVRQTLKDLCENSIDDLTQDVPEKFNDLVNGLRYIESTSIVTKLWREVKSGSICPRSSKLEDFFRDALVMGGTQGSIKQLVELINANEFSTSKANYGLTMLAFVNEPTLEAIKQLIPLVDRSDDQILRQALLGSSAMVHNYCRNKQNCKNEREIAQLVNVMGKHLSSRKDDVVIVVLKALRNIGQLTPEVQQKVLEIVGDKARENGVRVAGLETLMMVSEKKVYQKALEILEDMKNDSEVRINAYKVLMNGKAEVHMIDQIFRLLNKEESKQVGSYIVSHMKNMVESPCPTKKETIDYIKTQQIPTDKFPSDWRKFSKNFHVKNVYSSYEVGTVVDADLIYSHNSFMPTSARLEVGVPVFGQQVSLFTIGGRQVNLQKLIEKVGSPAGLLNNKNYPELINEIMSYLNEQVNEINSRSKRSYSERRLNLLDERVNKNSNEFDGSFYLNFDGKTIFYLESDDFKNMNVESMKELLVAGLRRVEKMIKEGKTDRAFSLMFLDINRDIHFEQGNPINIDVNGTLVTAFKNKDNSIFPSFAVEVSVKVGADAKNNKPGLKWTNNIFSAPSLKTEVEYSGELPSKVTFSLPKDTMTLFSYRSKLFKVEQNNREIEITSRDNHNNVMCLNGRQVFGIEMCLTKNIPKPFFNENTPLLPFNGGWNFDVKVVKTDRSMKGWELSMKLPKSSDNKKLYSIGFNTPGSSVNRENKLEVEITKTRSGKDMRIEVISPVKSLALRTNYKWDNNEGLARAELDVKQYGKYLVEAGLKKESKNRKTKYTPKLLVKLQGVSPLHMEGSILVENPSSGKPKVSVDLYAGESSNDRQVFVKGDITRDGPFSAEQFKFSTNLEGNLGFTTFNMFSVIQRQPSTFFNDFTLDYQIRNSNKHTVKVVSKMNYQSTALKKVNTFVQVKMSQYPEYNFQVDHTFSLKEYTFFENELKLKWYDEQKLIHLLETIQINDNTLEVKTLLDTKPWNYRYELNINGEKVDNNKFKYELKVDNKLTMPRNNVKHHSVEFLFEGVKYSQPNPQFKIVTSLNNKVTGKSASSKFEYKHIQKSPLKLSMDASVELFSGRKISYNDKLEETRPNEFHGKTILTWSPTKNAVLDYVYKMKSESNQYELDVNLKTPSMTIKHNGLLKMTRDNLVVKSNHHHNDKQIYSADFNLSSKKNSIVNFEVAGVNTKLEVNPFDRVKSANLLINNPELNHASDLSVNPTEFIQLNSKTNYNGKPIYTLTSQINPRENSKLHLTSDLLKVKLDHTSSSGRVHKVTVDLATDNYNHNSKVVYQPESFNINSKTRRNSDKIFDLNAGLNTKSASVLNMEGNTWTAYGEVDPSTKVLKVNVNGQTLGLKHNTEIKKENSNQWSAASSHKYNNREYYNLKSTVNPAGLSSLWIDAPLFSSNLDAKVDPRRSTNVLLKMPNNVHQINVDYNTNMVNLDCSSAEKGRNVAKLTGKLSINEPSDLKFNSERYGYLNFDLNPAKEAKLEFNNKPYNLFHSTKVTKEPRIFALTSQTEKDSNKWLLNSHWKNNEFLLNTECPKMNGEIIYRPERNAKVVRLTMSHKQSQYSHESELSLEDQKVTLKTQMRTKSGDKHKGDLIISTNEPSSFIYQGKSGASIVGRINPMGKAKSCELKVDMNGFNFDHLSSLNIEPTRYTINSNTDLNRENLYNWRSEVHPRLQSAKVDLKTKVGTGMVDYKKDDYVEWKLNNDRYNHETKVSSGKLDSETKENGRDLAVVSVKYDPSELIAEVKTPSNKAQVKYLKKREISWNVEGRNYEHSSVIRNDNGLTLKSNTKYNSRDLLNVEGASRNGLYTLNLRNENNKLKAEVEPMKKLMINIESPRVNHYTLVLAENRQYTITSKLEKDNRHIYELNSKIVPRSQSNINLDTEVLTGSIKVEPFRTLVVSLRSKADERMHKTDLFYQNNKFQVESLTRDRRGENYKLNGELNSDNGMINYSDKRNNIQVKIAPFGNNKNVDVTVKTNQINLVHNTFVKTNYEQVQIESKTNFNNKNYNLKTDLNKSKPSLSIETPALTGKVESRLNRNNVEVELDMKHKDRRVTGSVKASKENKFSLETTVNWDADRDSETTFVFNGNYEKSGKSWGKKIHTVSIKSSRGSKYELNLDAQITNDLTHGKHFVKLITKCPKGLNHIEFVHEIDDSNVISTKYIRKLNNEKMAELDSRINTYATSKIHFNCKALTADVEYENGKSGKLNVNLGNKLFDGQIRNDNNRINVELRATKSNNLIGEVSVVIPTQVRYAPLTAKLNYRDEKKALLKLSPEELMVNYNSDRLNFEHNSNFKSDSSAYKVKSVTKVNSQKYVDVDGNWSQRESTLKVETPKFNFDGEYTKGQKLNYRINYDDLEHESKWNKSGRKYDVESVAKKSNRVVYNVKSTINPDNKEVVIEVESPIYGEMKLVRNQRKINVFAKNQRNTYSHNSEVELKNNEIVFDSKTKSNYLNFNLNGKLVKYGESSVNYSDNENKLEVSVKPFGNSKSLNVVVNGRNVDLKHETTTDFDSEKLLFKSQTTSNSRKLYSVQTELGKNKQSINVESKFVSGNVNSKLTSANSNVNWNLKLNLPKVGERRTAGSIETTLTRSTKSIKSDLTWNNQKLVLDGSVEKIAYSNNQIKSNLNIKFNNRYTYVWNSEMASDFVRGPHQVNLKVNTPSSNNELIAKHEVRSESVECFLQVKQDSRDLFKLQSSIKPRSRSEIKLNTNNLIANAVYENKKLVLLNFEQSKMRLVHKSKIVRENEELVIESETLKNNRNILKVNSRLSRRSVSNGQIVIPQGFGKFEVNPGKVYKLNLKSDNFDHETSIRNERSVIVNSNTKYNNKVVADIQGSFRKEQSSLKINTPKGHLNSEYKKGDSLTFDLHVEELKKYIEDGIKYVIQTLKNNCHYKGKCYQLVKTYERQGLTGVKNELKSWSQQAYDRFTDKASELISRLVEKYSRHIKYASYKVNQVVEPIMNHRYVKFSMKHMSRLSDKIDDLKESTIDYIMSFPAVNDLADALFEMIDDAQDEMDSLINANWNSDDSFFKYNVNDDDVNVQVDLKKRRVVLKKEVPASFIRTHNIIKENIGSLVNQINLVKAAVNSDWLPPFKTQAMIVGGQHFVTFDKTFYDFASNDCTFLLARDFNDGNFTVMVKYEKPEQRTLKVRKSLIVTVNNNNIEINPSSANGKVKLNDEVADLPLKLKDVTVYRTESAIVVDDKRGVNFECHLEHDFCTLSMTGWYFGKTAGLFGTYDYERFNDMTTPNGDFANSPLSFASSWSTRESCRVENIVKVTDVEKSSNDYKYCENLFKSTESPLAGGFNIIDPKPFFDLCLRHVASTKKHQTPEKATCTIAATYKKLLENEGLVINMPSRCFTCENKMEYGSKSMFTQTINKNEVDVVFVVEEHECNRNILKDIGNLAKIIEKEMKLSRYNDVRFGVTGFGSSDDLNDIHFHTARSNVFFRASDVVIATRKMNLREKNPLKDDELDIYEAIVFASQYPWRPKASKNIILMTCTPCQEEVMKHDYSTIQQLLLTEGITMHILNDRSIQIKNEKARGVFAIDAKTVYRGKDISQKVLLGQPEMRSQVRAPKDVCIALAQESSGSFFSTSTTSGVDKQWKSILARRVADSSAPPSCVNCYCVADKNGFSPKTNCKLCQPRSPVTRFWN